MPGFSAVDDSADPERLARYLDSAALGQSGVKAYMAAAQALRLPAGPILDLGCGAGHDLDLLTRAGMAAVGIDPSETLVNIARQRLGPDPRARLIRGSGEALPYRDEVFSGVRIERVLQHVAEPAVVVSEAVRVLRPDGLLTIFEPDWSRMRWGTDDGESDGSWLTEVANPSIGGQLWEMVEKAGCRVLDRVEELSGWRSLAVIDRVLGPGALERAVSAGRIGPDAAERWLDEQRHREAHGQFVGMVPKILLVAGKPGS
ncbi:MAG: methyltransferase domain-containing protein [Acidimicrobiales bacterium]